ncbi:hypothetical protein FO519_003149 [Halicephalobus sp. NKZ332]|nr:hypothetical protein FO519_003149 [Halicephalobus sp. NKZ332]
MKVCYKEYFDSCGFPAFPFPPNPNNFDNTLNAVMKRSIQNGEDYCGYYNTLYKCLNSASECITYDNVARALDNTDNFTAANYVGAFFLLQYVCGPGFEDYKESINCSVDVTSCGNSPTTCDEAADYIRCVDEKVNSACGKTAATYECNYETIIAKYTTPYAACDTDAMKACYKGYFKSWGFSDTPFPPNKDTFDNTVIATMQGSVNGIETSCNYYNTLYKCLGSTSECITYDNIAKALDNTDNLTAGNYVGAFFVLQYSCGEGLEDCKKTIGCAVDATSCGDLPLECNGLGNFINCVDNIIAAKCSTGAAIYQCNYESIIMKYTSSCNQYPNCDDLNFSTVFGIELIPIFISILLLFSC